MAVKPARGRNVGSLSAHRKGSNTRSWAEHHWHDGDVNLFPPDQQLFDRDVGRLIREYALTGYAPSEPMLTADDSVITLGSCFARELRTFLRNAGLPASRLAVPAGLNNTYALLDFVSWCTTGEETQRAFRYDRLETGEIEEWKPEEERVAFQQLFAEAGAFVFTFGLAEVWQDRETGGVFWRGVPDSIFDADRHVFRLTTVEENAANIRELIALVRRINPTAVIVLTLSPVPLKATFRDIACLSADCVSKSVLRVAIDQVTSEQPAGVHYWPSFEVVKWAGPHLPWPAYGFDDGVPRHVTRYLVSQIVDAFVESFYPADVVAEMRRRQASKGGVPGRPDGLRARLEAGWGRRRKARSKAGSGGD